MRAIEEIEARLKKFPQAKYEINKTSISIFPTSGDGFTVSLYEREGNFTVAFDGWHEEFQDKDAALNCFAFGLSSECRLKEVRRGKFACKWTVESWEDGEWIEDSTTGFLIFPFWKKEEVRYLQNTLLPEESSTNQPRHRTSD